MATKSNIRSMRFSDKILEMIEAQAGESFTAKFENLVTRCMWELPNREKELKRIEDEIARRRDQLQDLNKKVSSYMSQVNNIGYSLRSLEGMIERAIEENV